ncbi:LOW QUALITY PROTEIN: centrosomal protein of 290 kDa-like [Macrobrachium rosenbergii]|uniref:LOW QUALITY PROTEIN: centrosomal protein of 290 kDa-like n=1 Tax=Macrobrachium rosenbergii TaxID=79674 RepID=UPI0034D49331
MSLASRKQSSGVTRYLRQASASYIEGGSDVARFRHPPPSRRSRTLAGISKLRSRDKAVEKLELLFTLTQAVMMCKYSQVVSLEEEIGRLAEAAGRGDAQREQELEAEVSRLKTMVANAQAQAIAEDENIAYDWSSGWRLKKKEMEEAIQRKNNEIQQFMDDLQACESERSDLRMTVEELRERLAEATRDINSITADYLSVKESLSHAQESLLLAREEVNGLKSHTGELTAGKSRIQQKYDELSTAVDAKVNQLKVVVAQREAELQKLRSQLHQRSVAASSAVQPVQGDLSQVIQLEQELKEKDLEIARLQEKLSEASNEIESSALLISKLKKSKISAVEGEAAVISQLRAELHEAQEHMQRMRTQLLAAEEDAQLHAQDLSVVIGELQSYMAGEFSLADAVRELKEARNQVRVRDSQITQLTGLVNSLQININDLIEENGELREQLKLEPREDIDLPGVNRTNWQDSKKIIERLTNQVNKLQDEKVTLKTKVYELTRELSNSRSSLQLTTLEIPKGLSSGHTMAIDTQPLEEQLSNLSAAVKQLVEEKDRQPSNDCQRQLEDLREKYLKLEGEKSSLERILAEDRAKKKVTRESETSYEEIFCDDKKPVELKSEPVVKSPMAALDELIAALGSLPPSTEEVIAKLKNQVNYLIQECNKREEEINQREKSAVIYTNQFDSLHEQVSGLNEQFSSEKEKWASERQTLVKEIEALTDEISAQKARVEEMSTTIDAISSGQDGVDGKIANRLAELRYDLEVSKCKNNSQGREIADLNQNLKEKLQGLHSKCTQEKKIRNEYEQEVELLKHRISRLEEELNQSVPRTMADQTAAQMANITAKYRSLLQDQALMAQKKEGEHAKDLQIKQLTEEREQLGQLLESAREKVHSLQASLNLVGSTNSHIQVEVLSKQLAAVELRELREKQKAEHSTVMYQNIKRECEELQQHATQLQNTVDSIAKMNLALQTTEMDLRQKLQGTINEEEHQHVLKELQQLKDEKAQLSSDIQRLQNLTEVSDLQMKQKQFMETKENLEMEQLRQKAHDLAAISNERAKIGELHQDIVLLKVKNLELLSELEETKAINEKQGMKIIRLSHQLRDRERLLETATDSSRSRAIRLYAIVRDLGSQQYAGAVPLSQQERLVDLLETLKLERNKILNALQSAQHDKMEAKVALRQLKVKQEALDELKSALTSKNVTKQVSSWCSKLEEVKLRSVELDEKLQSLEEEKSLYLARIEGKDKRLVELQAQLSSMEKTWMDEQLVWDEREAEMSRALEEHEYRHQKAVLELKTLEQQDLPDQSQPLAKQLEKALDALRNKSVLLEKFEKEIELLKNEAHDMRKELREKDIAVIARDQVINELRIKGSNLKSLAQFTDEAKNGSSSEVALPEDEGIAIIINGLKERLALSQEAVSHYQDLLSKSHTENQSIISKNKDEILRITKEREEAMTKVRELQSQLNNIPTRDPGMSALSEAQITQIHNLEDTVKMLDVQLEETRNGKLVAEGKVAQLERELTVTRREYSEEKEHMEVSSQVRAQQHQREIDRLSGEINNIRNERDDLRKEITLLKESANRTPSAILRTLVEKLRDQLIEKEKQVAKLSFAVQEMKERVSNSTAKDEIQEDSEVEKDVAESMSRVVESLKTELEAVSKAKADLEYKLNEQSNSFTIKNEQSIQEIEDLKQELKGLKSQNLKIEKQMLQLKRSNNSMKQKLEDLEGKSPAAIVRTIQSLKEKLEKMDATQEIEDSENRRARSQEQIVRWEERKKSKGVIDKLKARVKELEESLEVNKKKLETSQELLSRIEKEKLSLQFKLNNINKVSTDKMCGVCLKTLNPLELGNSSLVQEESSPAHTSRSHGKTFRQMYSSPSPDRPRARRETMSRATSPVMAKRIANEDDDAEMKLRGQLKKSLEDKQRLETKLKGAVEEVAALRKNLQQKEEEEERRISEYQSMASKRRSGAAVILEYESRILSLEEEVRQKSRLLAHVKQVVREAAAREESLLRDKESLFKRVTLLESVSEDTPAAHLIHELRQAKLTVTRLQRHIDELQCR